MEEAMQQTVRIGRLALFAAAAVLVLASTSEAQESLVIEKIKVPQLDLYGDGNSTTKVGVLDAARVNLPIQALAKAPNGRLKIALPDGRQVWIDGMWVTLKSSGNVVPCDPGKAGVTTGATRGSAERC